MTEIGEERPELAEKLSELEILRQSLEAAKAKEKEMYDQLLRLGAEFENFRKRNEVRVSEARINGKADVLSNVISLSDVLMHADEATQKATDIEIIKKGIGLVRQQFEKFLTDFGIQAIKAEGEKLDPHLHEVIAQEVKDGVEEGVIIGEIQKGYKLFDRVLRPARVRVAAKAQGSQEEQEHV